MRDKLCVVTGATGGIGFCTARGLARLGATVVLCGRDPAKTEACVQSMSEQPGHVEGFVGDLASLATVRRLADHVLSSHGRLDVLVNNVGSLYFERQENDEGIECTWALNHLGPFLLTNLLLERLEASGAGRVVTLSSSAHRRAKLDFADLEGRKNYHPWRAYAQSKLANVLFTYELERRLKGRPVSANALHPGTVATGFPRPFWIRWAKRALVGTLTLSPQRGARSSLHLASSPELSGVSGAYFDRGRKVRSAPRTYDTALARELWDLCVQRSGLR